jgi:hypothetical protein
LTAFGHIPALPSGGKVHFRGIRAGWAVLSGPAGWEPNITAPTVTHAIGIESLARPSIGESRKRDRCSRSSARKIAAKNSNLAIVK